jgi:cell division protein FtsN
MASKSNSWSLFLRYQAQAERHGAPSGPRAVEEFERLKALREELPNEAILEAQPEQTETTCTPSETNPSPPEDPAPAPDPPASVSELELDLAGAPGVLEDPEVEARHPNNAPAPQPASPVIGGEAWSLPEQRAREPPLADS